MQSCLSSVDAAIRSGEFPAAGTPAGTLAVRAADLLVRGSRSVTVAGAAPKAGDETVFSRPVLSAPAFARRDGTVLADAWLPEAVRLGVLEAHLGDGVIEKIVAKGLRNGRLPLRERLAAAVLPDGDPAGHRDDPAARLLLCRGGAGPGRAPGRCPVHPGLARPDREDGRRVADADPPGDHAGGLLARGRGPDRRRRAVGGHGGRDARRRGRRDAGERRRHEGEPGLLRHDRDRGRGPPRSRSCGSSP